jgi:flagellar M-ring protein FliF
MGYLNTISKQLADLWKGMSPGRRFGLLLVSLVSVAVVLGVGYWASQPDYRVLYAGLTVEDSSAITSKLQAQGVPYRLAAGGTTVLVSAEQVQQRRLELAADGLPAKGGKGFELFDQSPLGMTPFTQHVNYLRALQAELAKTIMQIDPVVFARVHIVRPDPSPFIRDQKPTTASVMLRLKPGTTLGRQLGAGIAALVARSVEGLTRENVTLVDANGKLLSDEQSQETGHVGSQLEYRRELETYLSSKAETMLAQVFGPGRAVVRVTADINFQRHHEKKETYNPDGRVATSEKIITTKSSTTNAQNANAAGAASNLPRPGGGGTASSTGNNSLDETVQTEFAVSKTIQEFEDKMGTIERLTVAALVDLSGSEKDKAAAMELDDVKEIIKQAVGFKPTRDEIKVTNVKLNAPTADPTADEEWRTMQRWQNIMNIIRNASLGVTALVALLMGWMFLRRFKPAPASPQAVPAEEEPDRAVILRRLSTTAERDPQAVAQVLENWLQQPERTQKAA